MLAAEGDKASEVGDEAVEGESSEIAGLGQVENVDAAVDLHCEKPAKADRRDQGRLHMSYMQGTS